jgi:CBS domain-containing protein
MAQSISEVMTTDLKTVAKGTPISEAAKAMRDADTGAIIVTDDGRFAGLVTDRDIVVRGLAAGKGPDTPIDEVTTSDVKTIGPDQTVDDALAIVRDENVRRVPVVDGDRPVGIVSIGDLSEQRDLGSELTDISTAPANN